MDGDAVASRRRALALAAGLWAFYLILTPQTSLWDRDEPRFARAAVEMYESGQYLYPTFGGELRAAKPILIYWLMTLSIRVFGATELAVRFWAPVGIAVAAYATFVIGRRLISPRAGLIALAVVALNPLAFMQATAATTDAVLLAFITSAMAAIAWRWTSPERLGPALLFITGVTGGLLTKGPVGLLPLLVASGVLFAWRRRTEARLVAGELAIATVIAIGLFALWAIAANAATGGRFASEGIAHEIVARVLTPLEGHGGNPLWWLPFYPIVVLVGFAPWSSYLPAALDVWRHDSTFGDGRALLAWWIAGPLLAFSLVATHLPHYVLPAWPPLALAVAAAIDAVHHGRARPQTRQWVARGAWITAIVAVAAGLMLAAAPLFINIPGLLVRSLPCAAIVVVGTAISLRAVRSAEYARAFRASLASTALFLAAVGMLLLPGVEAVKPVPRLVGMLRAGGHAAAVATYAFSEPTLDFYLGAVPERLDAPADVIRWADAETPGVLITTRAALQRLEPLRLDEVAAAEGFNIANGRRVELVALERRPRPPSPPR